MASKWPTIYEYARFVKKFIRSRKRTVSIVKIVHSDSTVKMNVLRMPLNSVEILSSFN